MKSVGGVAAGGRLDDESAEWLRLLTAAGTERDVGLDRLHERLLRVASHEVHRRTTAITGPELADIAHQAASDAMVAILAKLDTFRGDSRFTTWIYRFVILEVSAKLGRHYWRNPPVPLDDEDWGRLPDRFGFGPAAAAEAADLLAAIQRAVDETLTDHQRRLFVATVLNGVPLDAMIARFGGNRNSIYKTIFDARRKIRAFLSANGYLTDETPGTRL
ncbi:MAG TPA: RNA polymerase subunit sigma-70 [Mycobacterium sp.]|jgi:RNA polymerase sigma-70 factor (ECF subfamily)|nr:RNA polymerase subunit sigma-70 [Mycobacterium sp.]